MTRQSRYPLDVNVQDWSQWPYVQRAGYLNIAAQTPRGYPTISQSDAYLVHGHPPIPRQVNHLLHLVLTFFTVGLWVPVWFTVMLIVHNQNTQVEAVYWGNIQRYWQWEQAQNRAISSQRAPNLGG